MSLIGFSNRQISNHRVWIAIIWALLAMVPIHLATEHIDSGFNSDPRQKPFFLLWKQLHNNGQNNKKSLLNDEGLRFKKFSTNSAYGPLMMKKLNSLIDDEGMRFKKPALLDDEGLRFKKDSSLINDEGMRFKKDSTLFNDEGMRFKKESLINQEGLRFKKGPTLLNDEGMRFKKQSLINDEGLRFKKADSTLFNDEGMRFKKDSLIDDEGMRFKKDPLINDEGLRFKKAGPGGLIDDEGMRFKRPLMFFNQDGSGSFRYKKNPNDLIDKNLIIRKSVLDGEGLRFKKGSSLLDKEGMRFKKSFNVAKNKSDKPGKLLLKQYYKPALADYEFINSYERRSDRSGNQDILDGEGMRF